jgi:hypothetical protein
MEFNTLTTVKHRQMLNQTHFIHYTMDAVYTNVIILIFPSEVLELIYIVTLRI